MRVRPHSGNRQGGRTRLAHARVDHALDKLLLEYRGRECPHHVIAARTGLHKSGVTHILQRAKMKLRERLMRELDKAEVERFLTP